MRPAKATKAHRGSRARSSREGGILQLNRHPFHGAISTAASGKAIHPAGLHAAWIQAATVDLSRYWRRVSVEIREWAFQLGSTDCLTKHVENLRLTSSPVVALSATSRPR